MHKELSCDHPVISRVPQGTALGPLHFIIMCADTEMLLLPSALVCTHNTRVYNQISDTEDCYLYELDLNSVYRWAKENNMFFYAIKIYYLHLNASIALSKINIYINLSIDIIPQPNDAPDIGSIMSKDNPFDSDIFSLSRKCKNLTGWTLRSFVSCDKMTMLTLFKSFVISRLSSISVMVATQNFTNNKN